ncbi:MAG: polyketide synthase [Chloroflexi bacterium]|nr:MAG: polyketide synthase [Chloroflexota bacterium]
MRQEDDDMRLPERGNVDSNGGEPGGEMRRTDVAIIGISGIFAGSASLEAFWNHLQAGRSCIEAITRKDWQMSTYAADTNASLCKRGGMLQDIDQFDPLFFNISPLEAERMDPQQRLFLEEAYKAFEDAGYSTEQLAEKKVSVFVGARTGDYRSGHACRKDLLFFEPEGTELNYRYGEILFSGSYPSGL